MAQGEVDVVLVGADRVVANGDTANKVGTYTLAVLAARHGIPFYVCAPTSSVDLETPDGARDRDRGAEGRGGPRVPRACASRRPGPGPQPGVRRHARRADRGIVTEEGVLRAPFADGLRDATERARARWAPARESRTVALATEPA